MEKSCHNCTYFPCTKVQCTIGNKEGCNDFKSTIKAKAEEISKEVD